MAHDGGVRDAGMVVWGSHGDPGKPSVHPPQIEEGARAEEQGKTGEMRGVGEPKGPGWQMEP